MEISEKIKAHRKQKGLTMEQLGTFVGCTRQAIFKYEDGSRIPDLDTLASIAISLEVRPIDLLPDWFLEMQCN